jgi:hypothetical protein
MRNVWLKHKSTLGISLGPSALLRHERLHSASLCFAPHPKKPLTPPHQSDCQIQVEGLKEEEHNLLTLLEPVRH